MYTYVQFIFEFISKVTYTVHVCLLSYIDSITDVDIE